MSPSFLAADDGRETSPDAESAGIVAEHLSKWYSGDERDRFAPAQPFFRSWRARRAGTVVGPAGEDFDDEFEDEETAGDVSAAEDAAQQPRHEWALRDVSFSARRGAPLGVIGEPAAGKTTLARILGGLIPPTDGRALIRGRQAPTIEFATLLMRPDVPPLANARQIARLMGVPRPLQREVAARALALAFPTARDLQTASPKGALQRIATALAVDVDADVLVLDEPPLRSDAAFGERVLACLTEAAASGATILLATRDLRLVERICTDALWLEEGRVVMAGTVDDVVSAYQSRRRERAAERAQPRDDEAPAKAKQPAKSRRRRGFNAHAALLDVRSDAPEACGVGLVTSEEDLRVRMRIEVAATSVELRCALRVARSDGWSRRYAHEAPIVGLEPGLYEVEMLIPAGSIPDGRYVVDGLVRILVGEKKSIIGRSRVLLLDVSDAEREARRADIALTNVDEAAETIGDVSGNDGDTEEPLYVTWTIDRVGD